MAKSPLEQSFDSARLAIPNLPEADREKMTQILNDFEGVLHQLQDAAARKDVKSAIALRQKVEEFKAKYPLLGGN